MSKKLLRLFGILCFISLMVSCEKETSVENGFTPAPGNNNGGNTNDVCKSCAYVPWCDSTSYTFIDTTSTGAATSTSSLSLLSDTTIAGVVYTKSLIDGGYTYHNCTNGVSTVITYNATTTGGSTVTEFKTTLLKENDPVGSTWTDVYNNNGTNVDYKYTIMAKSINRTVLGVNYADVIQVHLTVSTTVPILGTVVASEGDNYYARGIGMIESSSYNGTTGLLQQHRVLQAYHIP